MANSTDFISVWKKLRKIRKIVIVSESSFYILPEDRAWAEQRIAALEAEIQAMAPDINEALQQSNEIRHGNALVDILREKQSRLIGELEKLQHILQKAAPKLPPAQKGVVAIGNSVVLFSSDERRSYKIAGDWTSQSGVDTDGSLVVCRSTSMAQVLLGKCRNDEVALPPHGRHFVVTEIR